MCLRYFTQILSCVDMKQTVPVLSKAYTSPEISLVFYLQKLVMLQGTCKVNKK